MKIDNYILHFKIDNYILLYCNIVSKFPATFRSKFNDYILKAANSKARKALTDERYNEIVEELKRETYNLYNNTKRRINRNGYCLMNFPKLGLKDVLCTPSKQVCLNSLYHNFSCFNLFTLK